MMRLVLFALLSMNIWIGPVQAASPYGADFNGDGYGDLVSWVVQ